MTSARVYSGALTIDDAIAEVRQSAGGQFDPRLADVLVELLTAVRPQVPAAPEQPRARTT